MRVYMSALFDDVVDPLAELDRLREQLRENAELLKRERAEVARLEKLVEDRDEEIAVLKRNVSCIFVSEPGYSEWGAHAYTCGHSFPAYRKEGNRAHAELRETSVTVSIDESALSVSPRP